MPHVPLTTPARAELSLDRLADCIRRLDAGTRALLDLSVRRGVRDDQMAPMLQTDPFHLAWRRARALEAVASDFGGDSPAPLAEVRAALQALPPEVWLLGAGPAALPERAGEPSGDPAPGAAASNGTSETASEAGAAASTELVPAVPLELDEPPPRRGVGAAIDRLDAFAVASPTLREAMAGVARALARKAVRTVIWRRRSR